VVRERFAEEVDLAVEIGRGANAGVGDVGFGGRGFKDVSCAVAERFEDRANGIEALSPGTSEGLFLDCAIDFPQSKRMGADAESRDKPFGRSKLI